MVIGPSFFDCQMIVALQQLIRQDSNLAVDYKAPISTWHLVLFHLKQHHNDFVTGSKDQAFK